MVEARTRALESWKWEWCLCASTMARQGQGMPTTKSSGYCMFLRHTEELYEEF